MDHDRMLAVLDEAYLGRVDHELDNRVNEALDSIAATGPDGVNVLLQRLHRDVRIEELGILRTNFSGEMAHNRWLQLVMVVDAIGRTRSRTAVPKLLGLLAARSQIAQFYDLLQPALVRALAKTGDKETVGPLRANARREDIRDRTREELRKAIRSLAGKAWWQFWR